MSSHPVLLFDTELISPHVQSALPNGYLLRPLSSEDYDKGFLDTLNVLTVVGNLSKAEFLERFAYLKRHNHEYFTLVIENAQGRIVAAGTIFLERKFVHHLGLVGHIEDIAVDKNQQGKKFGFRIIDALKYVGTKLGCYKIILDCSEKNVPFYEKCGFKKKEVEMAYYIPENDKPKSKL
ncbi:uncharacterized protein VTP21DRAFT_9442 [Calcarisporiella thermophila]|uniref:uncharacterized protein n=1 Tax=Calcarisporiella thermophila TaxID=911321 RepID=UPI003742631D